MKAIVEGVQGLNELGPKMEREVRLPLYGRQGLPGPRAACELEFEEWLGCGRASDVATVYVRESLVFKWFPPNSACG